MANVCFILGLCSSVLSLACIIVALASSQWLRIRSPDFMDDVGLMRHCDADSSYCGEMEHLNALVDGHFAAWFRSIQAMYLLHCLGMLVSTVVYILYAIRFLETKGSFRVLTLFNFVSLAAGIYSVAMFGMNHRSYFGIADSSVTEDMAILGYGFNIAITGCCLAFLTMLFSAMEASRAVDLLQNMQNRFTVWTTPYTLFVDQEA